MGAQEDLPLRPRQDRSKSVKLGDPVMTFLPQAFTFGMRPHNGVRRAVTGGVRKRCAQGRMNTLEVDQRDGAPPLQRPARQRADEPRLDLQGRSGLLVCRSARKRTRFPSDCVQNGQAARQSPYPFPHGDGSLQGCRSARLPWGMRRPRRKGQRFTEQTKAEPGGRLASAPRRVLKSRANCNLLPEGVRAVQLQRGTGRRGSYGEF